MSGRHSCGSLPALSGTEREPGSADCTNVQDGCGVPAAITGRMEGLPGFLLAAVALAGSPGPATLSLAAAGAAFGARRVAGYLAGIVVGMVAVMAITASGVVGLLLAVPGATPVVTVRRRSISSGWPGASPRRRRSADDGERGSAPSFAAGFGCRWSIPRAMRRWRRCSRASCCCASRLALDAGVKIARADGGDHRASTCVAAGRRAADALLPRSAQQPDRQRRLRRAAAGVGGVAGVSGAA